MCQIMFEKYKVRPGTILLLYCLLLSSLEFSDTQVDEP